MSEDRPPRMERQVIERLGNGATPLEEAKHFQHAMTSKLMTLTIRLELRLERIEAASQARTKRQAKAQKKETARLARVHEARLLLWLAMEI